MAMIALTPKDIEKIKNVSKSMPPLDDEDELSWIAGLLLQLNDDYLKLDERVGRLEQS